MSPCSWARVPHQTVSKSEPPCLVPIAKSCLKSFVIPWTLAHQAPLSMGFSRKEYLSGLPFPPPGIFPTQKSTQASCIAGRFTYYYLTLNSITLKAVLYLFFADSVQFSSVAQSCPTLCDPMDCSTPGFPIHC